RSRGPRLRRGHAAGHDELGRGDDRSPPGLTPDRSRRLPDVGDQPPGADVRDLGRAPRRSPPREAIANAPVTPGVSSALPRTDASPVASRAFDGRESTQTVGRIQRPRFAQIGTSSNVVRHRTSTRLDRAAPYPQESGFSTGFVHTPLFTSI